MQCAIHAIGDQAIEIVLDVYEKVNKEYPRTNHRHRIEHAAITNAEIINRMKDLGVIPIPQPTLVHYAGDTYVNNLDEKLVEYIFANKTFIDHGLKPAGSSDNPIVPCSPMLGIYAAMTRETDQGNVLLPNERISLFEALSMYTKNAAFAAFEEDIKGTLEVGKVADMTILPSGFLEFKPEKIKNTKVEMTIIDGNIVYQQ